MVLGFLWIAKSWPTIGQKLEYELEKHRKKIKAAKKTAGKLAKSASAKKNAGRLCFFSLRVRTDVALTLTFF